MTVVWICSAAEEAEAEEIIKLRTVILSNTRYLILNGPFIEFCTFQVLLLAQLLRPSGAWLVAGRAAVPSFLLARAAPAVVVRRDDEEVHQEDRDHIWWSGRNGSYREPIGP